MLFDNQLEHILGQGKAPKIRILRFLIVTPGSGFSGREIAAAIGLSHVKCHTALRELNMHGVVTMRHSGKSILYQLNLKNILVKKLLIPLFEREDRLKNVIAEIILGYLKKPAPKSIILFGSFASGKANPGSDIDVLVIASKKKDIPVLKAGLEKAEIEITIGFGNHLAPLVIEEGEFKRKFRTKDPLTRNIVKESKVLFGESINELIASHD